MSPDDQREWEEDVEAERREAHAAAPESTERRAQAEKVPADAGDAERARVAKYAEAIYSDGAYCGDCEYLGWDECSQCRSVTRGYAKAAMAVADSEHAALVAENERLRGQLGIDAAGTTRAERLHGLVGVYRGDLERTEDRLERVAVIARRRGNRAEAAESALLRVRALADAFADDGLARHGGNVAWHIEEAIVNEKGDFPDASDIRIASHRARADAAVAALVEARAQVEAVRALMDEQWLDPANFKSPITDLLKALRRRMHEALDPSSAAADTPTGTIFESWCDACEVTVETPSEDEVNTFNREHDHPVDFEFGHIDLWREV